MKGLHQHLFALALIGLAVGGCSSPVGQRLQTGHGDWTYKGDTFSVRSWSYGLPGLMIFGEARDSGELEATMKNGPYGPSGFQGLVVCLTKQMPEDDGFHGSAAFFARYNRGAVELMDAVPYHKTTITPRILASSPAEVMDGASYTLRMAVIDGRHIVVWLNGRKSVEYTASTALTGKLSLLAANGSYVFKEVKYVQSLRPDLRLSLLAAALDDSPQPISAGGLNGSTPAAAAPAPRIPSQTSVTPVTNPAPRSMSSPDQLPVATYQVRPRYSSGSRRPGMSDEVVVDFTVDVDGNVRNAFALRSTWPKLNPAVVEAVSNWKFEPARKAGVAVSTHMQVPIVATLGED